MTIIAIVIMNLMSGGFMKICFEHPDFIIVEKPQGMPVQSKHGYKESLLSKLDSYFEFALGIEDPFLGMVHRLDQPTGGLIIIARTPAALKKFNQMIQKHEIHKQYLALVEGQVTPPSNRLVHYLLAHQKENIVTCYDTPDLNQKKHCKKAILNYQVLDQVNEKQVLTHDLELTTSLLQVTLETGRQHQIRSQLSHIGHPIVGDMKYGSQYPKLPLHLWAAQLDFMYKGQFYQFKSQPSFLNHLK